MRRRHDRMNKGRLAADKDGPHGHGGFRAMYRQHAQEEVPAARSTAPDGGATLVALAALAGILLVSASQQFAQRVDLLYVSLQTLAWLEFAVALLSAAVHSGLGRMEQGVRCVAVSLVALAAATCLNTAWWSYPSELSILALQHQGSDFWCALSPSAWLQASLHRVAAVAGFGTGLLLLAGAAFLPAAAMVAGELQMDARPLERGSQWLGSTASVIAGSVLVAAACHAHTADGWRTWQAWAAPHAADRGTQCLR